MRWLRSSTFTLQNASQRQQLESQKKRDCIQALRALWKVFPKQGESLYDKFEQLAGQHFAQLGIEDGSFEELGGRLTNCVRQSRQDPDKVVEILDRLMSFLQEVAPVPTSRAVHCGRLRGSEKRIQQINSQLYKQSGFMHILEFCLFCQIKVIEQSGVQVEKRDQATRRFGEILQNYQQGLGADFEDLITIFNQVTTSELNL